LKYLNVVVSESKNQLGICICIESRVSQRVIDRPRCCRANGRRRAPEVARRHLVHQIPELCRMSLWTLANHPVDRFQIFGIPLIVVPIMNCPAIPKLPPAVIGKDPEIVRGRYKRVSASPKLSEPRLSQWQRLRARSGSESSISSTLAPVQVERSKFPWDIAPDRT
jgi:hypothetical protein